MDERTGSMAVDDPKGLAAYVKLQRGQLRWKRELLASLAGVSLSTVERVERGDVVRPDVFAHTREMERRHNAVCLVGTYSAETDLPLVPETEIGVLALRSKKVNPAAGKIDVLFAERRIAREAIAWDA